jgi:hypothetical protein
VNGYLKTLLFIITFFFNLSIISESSSDYQWPVQGEKMVTGSFGEFRAFYFHLGLDFATSGKIGTPILSMNDGKLFKIQSLRYSIGNAALIKQNDGLTARYGHMSRFSDRILEALRPEIKEKIRFREDFENIVNEVEAIEIKKGEVIGYSGDTGIGPAHLHVELMEGDYYYNTASKLSLKDINGSIQVAALDAIPEDNKSFISGRNIQKKLSLSRSGDIINAGTITLKGAMSFRMNAVEATGRGNRIGFQKLSISLNGKELQEFDFSRIKADEMNRSCFILDNYKSNISGRPFRHFFHNREESALENFKYKEKNSGIITDSMLDEGKSNLVELQVVGLDEKKVITRVYVNKDTANYPPSQNIEKVNNIFPNTELTMKSDDELAEVKFESGSVYTPEHFVFEKTKESDINEEGLIPITPVYSVKPEFREFNKGYDLKIKIADERQLIWGKLGLFSVSERGKVIRYLYSANFKAPIFTMKLHSSGNFIVLSDQSKPVVLMHKWKNKQEFKDDKFKIYFKVRDSGTGVAESAVKAKIDGEDVKLDYEPEKIRYEAFYPDTIYKEGPHVLEIIATDRAGNISEPLKFEYSVKK